MERSAASERTGTQSLSLSHSRSTIREIEGDPTTTTTTATTTSNATASSWSVPCADTDNNKGRGLQEQPPPSAAAGGRGLREYCFDDSHARFPVPVPDRRYFECSVRDFQSQSRAAAISRFSFEICRPRHYFNAADDRVTLVLPVVVAVGRALLPSPRLCLGPFSFRLRAWSSLSPPVSIDRSVRSSIASPRRLGCNMGCDDGARSIAIAAGRRTTATAATGDGKGEDRR